MVKKKKSHITKFPIVIIFYVCSSVVSSIVTLLWNRSPELSHLMQLKLNTHAVTPPHPAAQRPGTHPSAFCLYGPDCSGPHISGNSICLCVTGLFQWAPCPQGSPVSCTQVTQLCPTLCNPMAVDYSPPGSSVHGILQARRLGWAAAPSSRGSSPPRDRTQVSLIAGGFFYRFS